MKKPSKIKRFISTVLTTVILAGLSTNSIAQSEKPNILVIWGDDIGWSNPSIYNMGMMGYATPNIDKIGKEGILCKHEEM